jgi:MEMO1 family protein
MSTSAARQPVRAGSFYPASARACAEEIDACRHLAVKLPAEVRGARIFGGVVPHAGWVYSGATAAAVFEALVQSAEKPETVIIFATCHRGEVRAPSLQRSGSWMVPSGEVFIDEELAGAMLDEAGASRSLIDQPEAHRGDHAIEVNLPFLMAMLPGARFVPVAMPHSDDGPASGEAAARAVKKLGRRTVALASTDLTHYGANYYGWAPKGEGPGAHRWSKDVNDRRFIERLIALDAKGAYDAGEEDGSACGPAAGAAVAAFARAFGATRGVLLEHVTSWERAKSEQSEPTDFVGYAAMVFI